MSMSDALTLASTIMLNNGVAIPRLGFGVYKIRKGRETEEAVFNALEAGYRHIDTASFYGNEREVGNAIRLSGIPRTDVFVTTKLWPTDFFRAEAACETSLKKLRFDYIDLYLIHWPVPLLHGRVWRTLEKLYDNKHCRAIGVSNYSEKNLIELFSSTCVVPAVNQVECSPFYYRPALAHFCKKEEIAFACYSPLTRGQRLGNEIIGSIAGKYEKTNAQIMLRWSLQHDFIVIPKSSNPERIKENAHIFDFEISTEDMTRLDMLNENYRSLFRS